MKNKDSTVQEKYFVSCIIGYFPALHQFALYQNYYLYPAIIAEELGYRSILIIKSGEADAYADKNIPSSVIIIEYKNFLHFLKLLTKYSIMNSVFYINNHQLISYFALVYTKLFFCKNIFMGHIQPKRTSKIRQSVFDCTIFFTSRVRLNNMAEMNFLIRKGISKNKLYIVPIAVDTTRFTLENTDYHNRNDMFYYGNTTTQKGLPTIFEAFMIVQRSFPDIKLHIVGSRGNYNPEPDIARLGISDTVVVHGAYRHGAELTQLLNQFKVFVIDTKAEGQCMAVYEAALTGNALCLPNIMSFTEVFKDKALFHELGDAVGLANSILEYMHDIDKIQRDNTVCIDMIKSEYTESVVKQKMIELLTFT